MRLATSSWRRGALRGAGAVRGAQRGRGAGGDVQRLRLAAPRHARDRPGRVRARPRGHFDSSAGDARGDGRAADGVRTRMAQAESPGAEMEPPARRRRGGRATSSGWRRSGCARSPGVRARGRAGALTLRSPAPSLAGRVSARCTRTRSDVSANPATVSADRRTEAEPVRPAAYRHSTAMPRPTTVFTCSACGHEAAEVARPLPRLRRVEHARRRRARAPAPAPRADGRRPARRRAAAAGPARRRRRRSRSPGCRPASASSTACSAAASCPARSCCSAARPASASRR